MAKPLMRDVTDWDEFTGRVRAVESVEIRARVSGYLESVEFVDGVMVEKGDLLYVIDPRPFRAALDEARARQASAEAQLIQAQNDEARAERLFKTRNIPEEELDNRRQRRRQAEADLDAAKAAVVSAALDLDFSRIRAPITGLISRTLVTPGNLVTGGEQDPTLLTTIVSLDPIHIYITAGENIYLRYLRMIQTGVVRDAREVPVPVRVRLADETEWSHEGYLDFVDNQLDLSTGTIQGRATVANPDGNLVPGLFAKVRVPGEGPYDALLVPDVAIGSDQAQRVVYVLGEDNIPRPRPVELGQVIGGLRVIRSGLSPEDQVLINGLARLRPGMPVTPVTGSIPVPEELAVADAG